MAAAYKRPHGEMAVDDDMSKHDQVNQQPPRVAAKRPYERPLFRFERVFETRALSCGKLHSTVDQCKHNRKHS